MIHTSHGERNNCRGSWETHLPSLPRETVEGSTQNDKSKEGVKEEDKEVVDEDYIFYFINHHVFIGLVPKKYSRNAFAK